MSEFMKTLLSLSVSGTLLLLLIWGFKRLYKNSFSRRWQYYIWIIAAFRFLLPFTPDTTLVGNLFEKLNVAEMASEGPASPNAPVPSASPASPNEPNTSASPVSPNEPLTGENPHKPNTGESPVSPNEPLTGENPHKPNTGESPVSPNEPLTVNVGYSEIEHAQTDQGAPNAHNSFDIYACLFWVWLTAALALFVRRIAIYQGFIRHMKAGNTEVSDRKALNVLSDCKEKLGIKTRVALYHNALITSPIMTGFFRPSIILPVTELTDKELSHIFAHELNHYKQGDMFYKWLIQIVICAHWFNPFVYRMEKEVNRACELSCDEAVISALDDRARREYGETLMKFIKSNVHKKNSLASVTLTEGAEQLKERLGAIMKFRKKTRLIAAISMIAAVLLSVGGFTIGAYAAQSGAKQEDSFSGTEGTEESPSDEISSSDSIVEGKVTGDVETLKAIIREQNAQGAALPADLNDDNYYGWDENGNLIRLRWSDCELKGSLSLKGLPSLTYLDCSDNELSSLDVSKNVALTVLNCSENPLSSLDVSGCTALTELVCLFNGLSSLDVSKNVALTVLDCSENQLGSLDVSGCTALTELVCILSGLSSLNASGCTALTELVCIDNELSSLDVSGCTALTHLRCEYNQLCNLDVSDCTALDSLQCFSNQLSSLDVSGCTALTYLDCSDNQLSSLDVSKNVVLDELYCPINQLSSLDVSKNVALTNLYCYTNELSSLDVSKNSALVFLNCAGNELSSLDVSKNPELFELDCGNNQLSSLDVSNHVDLGALFCGENQLSSLDVSGCTALRRFYCEDNQLSSLDVSGCTELNDLRCDKTVEVTGYSGEPFYGS